MGLGPAQHLPLLGCQAWTTHAVRTCSKQKALRLSKNTPAGKARCVTSHYSPRFQLPSSLLSTPFSLSGFYVRVLAVFPCFFVPLLPLISLSLFRLSALVVAVLPSSALPCPLSCRRYSAAALRLFLTRAGRLRTAPPLATAVSVTVALCSVPTEAHRAATASWDLHQPALT